MHRCTIYPDEYDVFEVIEIEGNRAWAYGSCGDFIFDFEINFCPKCGESVIPSLDGHASSGS